MLDLKENKELENVNGGVGGTSNMTFCDFGSRFNVLDNRRTEKHGCGVTDTYAVCPNYGKNIMYNRTNIKSFL